MDGQTREVSLTRLTRTLAETRTLVVFACLLLVSGDCGSLRNYPDTSTHIDPITVTLEGVDPVALDVTVRLTSTDSVAVYGELTLIDIVATPTPRVDVFISLDCPDSELLNRNLAYPPVFNLPALPASVVETAPADVSCTILITPAAEVDTPIEIEWVTAALIMWGYEDRNTDVGVAIEVVPL